MHENTHIDTIVSAIVLMLSISIAKLHLILSLGAVILYIVWLIIKIVKELNNFNQDPPDRTNIP